MEKRQRKKLARWKKALIALGCIFGAIGIIALSFYFHFLSAHKITIWRPGYDKIENLSDILNKPELSDEDYDTLYKQTGITKVGIDSELKRGAAGRAQILNIQQSYFEKHEVIFNLFAPYVCTDATDTEIPTVSVQKGDIIVTSSTHIAGFRVGHAGLAVNDYGGVLQATQVGSESYIGEVADFSTRCNFMILRPKRDKITDENINEICAYAVNNLQGKRYFAASGVLSKKTDENKTQCAQIVWCAFNRYGFDLDSDGGAVVTPQDLANSPYLELVQVFGFDPVKLWK